MVHELPQLSQYYSSMAQALDTTRHELQTQGVHIPEAKDDQAEFEGMSLLDQYIDLFFVFLLFPGTGIRKEVDVLVYDTTSRLVNRELIFS